MSMPLQPSLFQSILIASAVVAAAIPVVFVGVRQSTKLLRQGIVADLSSIFEGEGEFGSVAIPSFEFVKYKYKVSGGRGGWTDRTYGDFKIRHWLIAGVPLSLVLFVMNALGLSVVLHAAFKLPIPIGVEWLEGGAPVPLFAWVVLAGYAGGLLFTLRAFKQAVNNFDMSPLSLVGAIVNLAFGVTTGLLVAFSLFKLPSLGGPWPLADSALFPVVIVTAFAAGFYPDVAMRQLLKLSRLRNYKQEASGFYERFKAIPIDVIDGIDGEIRSRLADYHLNSVQNLATANPLMLFVETPYGVYEIMDWVAQAQLCSSVGPVALLKLWDIGIRTIFDLERVVLDDCCSDDVLIEQIGDILWDSQEHALARRSGTVAATAVHPKLSAVKADIRMRIENPHALRLRQIFNQVGHSLGEGARRLRPVHDFDPAPRRTSRIPSLGAARAAAGGGGWSSVFVRVVVER